MSFGVGRKNRADDAPVDHPLFESAAWDALPRHAARRRCASKARAQLGTVGSGNHYVDVFADEAGAIWVGVHFGSRGFGHTVASGFLALVAGRAVGRRACPSARCCSPLDHADRPRLLGADEARRAVRVRRPRVGRAQGRVDSSAAASWSWCTTITTSPGRRSTTASELVVVRKGATPAFPGQKGFIGGSMGDDAVIVQGA